MKMASEKNIMKEFCGIAFSAEAKDADRIRALEWISAQLQRQKNEDAVIKKLDEVLAALGASGNGKNA